MLVPDLGRGQTSQDPIENKPRQYEEASIAPQGKKAVVFGVPQQKDETIAKRFPQQSTIINVQTCPIGTAFYFCSNGYRGCANVDPCIGAASIDQPVASAALPVSVEQESVLTSRALTTSSILSSSPTAQSADAGATSLSIQPIPQTTLPTSTLSSALDARPSQTASQRLPSCPEANGTLYNDFSSVTYSIRCNADNIALSYASLQIGVGGYTQCFSSCSAYDHCAGFTYIGAEKGNCFFKSSMPNSSYVTTTQSSYISFVKYEQQMLLEDRAVELDRTAAGTNHGPMAGVAGRSSAVVSYKGVIVGAGLGLLMLIGLVLLIILLARRRHSGGISHRLRRIFPGLSRYLDRESETSMLPSHSPDSMVSPLDTIYAVPSPRQSSHGHARQRSIYTDHSGLI